MHRFRRGTLATLLLLLLAMAATLWTSMGTALWHYNVAFIVIAVAGVLGRRALHHRRVATLLMAFSGIVATLTGFAMLYTVQFPYKDWLTWWHSATSAILVVAFLAHWANNRSRLSGFTKGLLTSARGRGAALAGAWTAVALAAVWTWGSPVARAMFTSESYLYLASWAVLAGVVLAYGSWLAYRFPAARERLADAGHRNSVRALLDTSLFLAHWGALITGFALVWWSVPLRAGDLKYVSKWWHTATSVAFLAFVVLHIGFNARLLAAHARRVDADLRR